MPVRYSFGVSRMLPKRAVHRRAVAVIGGPRGRLGDWRLLRRITCEWVSDEYKVRPVQPMTERALGEAHRLSSLLGREPLFNAEEWEFRVVTA
jgi:hypothetical protein